MIRPVLTDLGKKGAESIRSRNGWRLRPALDGRVCLHALWQPHSAMDYAALSAVSFEQRAAHPWILCMALRQHRYPILLGPFMRAIHCSDWIRRPGIPMPHYALQS